MISGTEAISSSSPTSLSSQGLLQHFAQYKHFNYLPIFEMNLLFYSYFIEEHAKVEQSFHMPQTHFPLKLIFIISMGHLS